MAANLRQQWAEVQLLGGIHHGPGARDHEGFIVGAVYPQHFLAEDLVAIFHRPFAQWQRVAVGLQYQVFLTAQACLFSVESIVGRL